MNEQIVLHRIYRECIDSINDIWRRISFWSQASDVDLTQGETVQYRLDNLDLDSVNAKTLIDNFIYDANEAHRTLQLQLDQLRDNLGSRMTTLRSRYTNWKIVVGADPELVSAYETRLAEAEEEINAMTKAVEDELNRLKGLLDSILDEADNDPLAKDVIAKITTLQAIMDNRNDDIRNNYIGPGFNPDVQVIGPTLTDAILHQDSWVNRSGAKFWEYYYFKGDNIQSSENLDEVETVGGGYVMDFPYGSMVNIDYNRKLDICFVRGWIKLDSHEVFTTDIGEINLPNIFPKTGSVAFAPEYMAVDFGEGHYTVKVNTMIGSKKIVFAPRSSGEGYVVRWEGNYNNDKNGRSMNDYVNGTSDKFGDTSYDQEQGYPESFDSLWILFRGSYFDRGEGSTLEEVTIDTSRITVTGTINAEGSTITTYVFLNQTGGGRIYCVPENANINQTHYNYSIVDEVWNGSTFYCMISEVPTESLVQACLNDNVNLVVPSGYKFISVTYSAKTPPAFNETETLVCTYH